MKIKFTKMHGCGNDYVYVDGKNNIIPDEKKPEIVKFLSDRHFGIGSDGVIFINPDDNADFEMEMFNADGTRAQMCGNGIRCVAKFVYDKHMTNKTKNLAISSFGRNRYLDLTVENGKTKLVKVNMGAPIFDVKEVPVDLEETELTDISSFIKKEGITDTKAAVGVKIEVENRNYEMTCVSMGNPHAVVFLEDSEELSTFDLEKTGPKFENNVVFPARTNTEFIHVDDRKNIHMRVWERGTGETLACGTGCCASVVACILNNKTEDEVTVHVLGGDIICKWDREENLVYMTGPATTVFEGEIEI
nr:diaminopimelate epimerase [Butyrivibrio sp. NC3005]